MNLIKVLPYNATYYKLECDNGIAQEITDALTYFAPGYRHMPLFKLGKWDGRVKYFSVFNKLLYTGLLTWLYEFATARDYYVDVSELDLAPVKFGPHEMDQFIAGLDLPDWVETRSYQQLAVAKAIKRKQLLIQSPTNCHKKGDLVFCSDGWRTIESIKMGDYVYGADGKLKKVLDVFTGEDELFEIKPVGRFSPITVTGNHILPLRFKDYSSKHGIGKRDPNYVAYISVKDYLHKSKDYQRLSSLIYNETPIETDNQIIDCRLNPYFIGVYLGDGACGSCGITTTDKEIIDVIYQQAKELDCFVRYSGKIEYFFTRGRKNSGKRNPVFAEFDKIGIVFGKNGVKCATKFIPECLFHTSVDYRRQLMAGLLDSDGWLNQTKSYFQFSSKSQQLANDVQRLAVSLGLVAYVSQRLNKKYNRFYYNTIIFGKLNTIPNKLQRKQSTDNKRRRYNKSFSVTPVGVHPYFGITVEDHLYLTNDGMITHNSGKTLIAYLISRYYGDLKKLIIVPNLGLINQTQQAFEEFGHNPEGIHLIYSGQDKNTDKNTVISSWQSIYKLPKKWFEQWDVIIGDECHTFQAKSLKTIMENATNAYVRIGTTGSLDDKEVTTRLLTGLFGPVHKTTTNRELIDSKKSADLLVKVVLLKYDQDVAKLLYKQEFAKQRQYFTLHEKRNNFLVNLALSLDGNVLLLYRFVEQHGVPLFNEIQKRTNRKVFFVNGNVSGEERNKIRGIVANEKDAIIVASIQTFSTGIDIANLNYLILGAAGKSRINLLQSVGRTLRRADDKHQAVIFDVVDDATFVTRKGTEKPNYAVLHYIERMKIYNEEDFEYKILEVPI